MDLRILTPDTYKDAFRTPVSVFHTADFNLLNADKADAIDFLGVFDTKGKPRIGIITGRRDGKVLSPFSAPFGGFTANGDLSPEQVAEAVKLLRGHYEGEPVRLILPPPFYDPVRQPLYTGVLTNSGARVVADYNYHYPLEQFPTFTDHLDRSARNHLNHAMREPFRLIHTDDIDRAYGIIAQNRQEKGYPLAMTLRQVKETVSEIVNADFFVLTHNDTDVAAAMVYHVAPHIAQLIYWGHLADSNRLRPMSMLSYRVIEHYYSRGFKIFDLGPASTDGIPNSGLCSFKQAQGALPTIKPTFLI